MRAIKNEDKNKEEMGIKQRRDEEKGNKEEKEEEQEQRGKAKMP